MELLWDRGRASISIRGAAHPDALAHGGEHTDGQAGLVARLVLGPLSLSAQAYVRLGNGSGGGSKM